MQCNRSFLLVIWSILRILWLIFEYKEVGEVWIWFVLSSTRYGVLFNLIFFILCIYFLINSRIGNTPLAVVEITPNPLHFHPRQGALILTLSEPAIIGKGGLVLHQVLKTNRSMILNTIRVSPSLLTMSIDNQQVTVEMSNLQLAPNALYLVGRKDRNVMSRCISRTLWWRMRSGREWEQRRNGMKL